MLHIFPVSLVVEPPSATDHLHSRVHGEGDLVHLLGDDEGVQLELFEAVFQQWMWVGKGWWVVQVWDQR